MGASSDPVIPRAQAPNRDGVAWNQTQMRAQFRVQNQANARSPPSRPFTPGAGRQSPEGGPPE